MSIGGHQSAAMLKDEWLTPPWVTEAMGLFDLDPCSPVIRPFETARNYFTVHDDGLSKEWSSFGDVWCNPPYGLQATAWLSKLATHGNGIALIFARTETRMFFSQVWKKANALLFIEGRLYFHHVDGTKARANSGAPSVLIAYGTDAALRLKGCGIPGQYIPINEKT